MLEAATAPAGSFDKPKSIEYNLIVTPGAVPNYLGQAVASLMFDTIAARRRPPSPRNAISKLKQALVSNDLTLETSCTDFLVYASAGMITV
jgi:hypothetical protein